MGLPLEQWRGRGDSGDDGAAGKDGAPAAGCRTPGGAGQQARGDCPAAPRKRRPAPQQPERRRDYYTGDDVEAFFAAHNL